MFFPLKCFIIDGKHTPWYLSHTNEQLALRSFTAEKSDRIFLSSEEVMALEAVKRSISLSTRDTATEH